MKTLAARIQYSTNWKRWPIDLRKLIEWLEKTKWAEKGRSITTEGQNLLLSNQEIGLPEGYYGQQKDMREM